MDGKLSEIEYKFSLRYKAEVNRPEGNNLKAFLIEWKSQ